mgnify:CR=1 FL=1
MDYGRKRGRLVLEDGSVFEGYSFGFDTTRVGEVVFNTGMVGYPENLTDPSYRGQILTLTYPLIGNYGVPAHSRTDGLLDHFESEAIHLSGLIVSDYSVHVDHHSAVRTLSDWLMDEQIPALYGIDTRALTKHLRNSGTMLGCIQLTDEEPTLADPNIRNLAAEVSVPEPILYERGKTRIVLVDCGVKNNIIRAFLRRDITVLRVPWDFDFSREQADGILISNGLGDPALCEATMHHTRKAMEQNIPILGICLGSQILGLAAGAKTYKMPFGHRAHNQPCLETGTRRCHITSQNHGFAVDGATLPEDWREWFVNTNDESNEGLFHISRPFFGAQFHPEASPGPDDTEFIFDMFVRALS